MTSGSETPDPFATQERATGRATITDVRLLAKTGGKSGDWTR